MSARAVCYILDVGLHAGGHNGSSNVVIFPGPRGPRFPHAVVIDCGDQAETTLRLLRSLKVKRIEHIFITHNDRDHSGGLLKLVNAFRRRTGLIWFLLDRSSPIPFYPELHRLGREEQAFEGERFLAADDHTARRLFPSANEHGDWPGWSIDLIYPLSVSDVMTPQISSDPNSASAVLLLQCGTGDGRGRILFPGDARAETLKRAQSYFIRNGRMPGPIQSDIIVGPHHGGALRRGSRMGQDLYDALFREHVNCRFAIVSVATENSDGHPHEEHIGALSVASQSVLCTQITRKCCGDPTALLPGVLKPLQGVPQASDAADGRSGIACAGTVVVDVAPSPLVPRRWEEHGRRVDRLRRRALRSGDPLPLCRRRMVPETQPGQ